MHLYIKFSSADYAKKFNGMVLLADLDLSEPILLNGEIEFEAEDNYDECGLGYEDEEYMNGLICATA